MAATLRAALAGFDPALLSGEDAATLVHALAVTEKACAMAKVRAGARAAECRSHQREGFADAGEWLARMSGSTRGEAHAALETAAAVGADTPMGTALAAGDLSLEQAAAIRSGAAEDEAELLALSRDCSLAKLRDEVRRRR